MKCFDFDEALRHQQEKLDEQLRRAEEELNRNLNKVLDLGKVSSSALQQECSSADANFYLSHTEALNEDSYDQDKNPKQEGLIVTDTWRLSEKYHCNQKLAKGIINDFIRGSRKYRQRWHLLDLCDNGIDGTDWKSCNRQISFCLEYYGMTDGADHCVFIIGGSDVVGIPSIPNPYYQGHQIPTDMLYCFSASYDERLIRALKVFSGASSESDFPSVTLSMGDVRNNVSRLPLEEGTILTRIQDDLQGYLMRSLRSMSGGIPVKGCVMTTNACWKSASHTMSHHLPLICQDIVPELIYKGMYVSPDLSPNNDITQKAFMPSVRKADMMVFNLHGSKVPSEMDFYNDEDKAFCITQLRECHSTVFNTVACFGARYSGYNRNQSMLLSALYDGEQLLYAGSQVSVPMYMNNQNLNPGSGSEQFMPIFCLRLCESIPAGKAFLKAKLEYFNAFRASERDDFSLATCLMFDLYGNPMMRVQRNNDVIRRAAENHFLDNITNANVMDSVPIQLKHKICLMERTDTSDILSMVTSQVDQNLSVIHNTIQRQLYEVLGLPTSSLAGVDKYVQSLVNGNREEGYVFSYHDTHKKYGQDTWVETNLKGDVLRVIRTK